MPSQRTRQAFDRTVIATAEVALTEAADAVAVATGNLEDLTAGNLELDAVNVGGVRLVWNGTDFEPEV